MCQLFCVQFTVIVGVDFVKGQLAIIVCVQFFCRCLLFCRCRFFGCLLCGNRSGGQSQTQNQCGGRSCKFEHENPLLISNFPSSAPSSSIFVPKLGPNCDFIFRKTDIMNNQTDSRQISDAQTKKPRLKTGGEGRVT